MAQLNHTGRFGLLKFRDERLGTIVLRLSKDAVEPHWPFWSAKLSDERLGTIVLRLSKDTVESHWPFWSDEVEDERLGTIVLQLARRFTVVRIAIELIIVRITARITRPQHPVIKTLTQRRFGLCKFGSLSHIR